MLHNTTHYSNGAIWRFDLWCAPALPGCSVFLIDRPTFPLDPVFPFGGLSCGALPRSQVTVFRVSGCPVFFIDRPGFLTPWIPWTPVFGYFFKPRLGNLRAILIVCTGSVCYVFFTVTHKRAAAKQDGRATLTLRQAA